MRQLPLFMIVALITASDGTQRPVAGSGAEQEVRQLVSQLTASYKNDLPTYFSNYASDLTMWWPIGRVDKERYQKSTATRGDLEAAEVSDLHVQASPSGDAAVASYILTLKESPSSESRSYQMSVIWFRRDGKWQIVHLHYQPKRANVGG
jgi:ketosteroid isomerase-like protein